MQTVVLAGGRGSRMGSLTKTIPKPMQPCGSKPLVAHVADAAVAAGTDELVVVTGYHGEHLREFFGDSYEGVPVAYTHQDSPDGTADAVATATDLIDGQFAVLNGDNLYDRESLRRLYANAPAIGTYRVDDPTEYGVVSTDGGQVTGVVEKPADPPSALANAGAYVLPEAALDHLEVPKSDRGEYELPDVVERVIDEHDVSYVEFDRWMDVGRPWELLEANERVLATQERAIDGDVHPDATVEGPVVVEEGATVRAGVTITGPVRVRAGATVGPNAYVRGATLVDRNVTVGHAVEIKNSVLMAGAAVPHLSYVGDSVVGRDVNLGAGTVVANLRHDDATVELAVNGTREPTGRRKFGAVVGDGVQTGINTSIEPGITLSTGARTDAGETVSRDR